MQQGEGMDGMTWREALNAAQRGIDEAHERRAEVFRAAHDAGLSLRQIADAVGSSAPTVQRIIGPSGGNGRNDALLDARVTTGLSLYKGASHVE